MKLFKSEGAQEALVALFDALQIEAEAAGETIKTVIVTSFTTEDSTINNTAVAGCNCTESLERARRSVLAIIEGTSTQEAVHDGPQVH